MPLNSGRTEIFMSVQNNLKKPAFTKTVMGYTVSEVDKYIEHITERYNSVSAENSELKRRVLRLQMKLDELSGRLNDAEADVSQPKPLDRRALIEVFDVLDSELRRTQAFYEDLKGRLNDISEEKESGDDDSAWEETLSAFISSVPADEPENDGEALTEDAKESDVGHPAVPETQSGADSGIFADFESFVMGGDEDGEADGSCLSNDASEAEHPHDELKELTDGDGSFAESELHVTAEPDEEELIMNSDGQDSSYEQETEMLLKLLQGTFSVTDEEEKSFEHDLGAEFAGGEDDSFSEDEDDDYLDSLKAMYSEPDGDNAEAVQPEMTPEEDKREKTPAEIAAELDFYTDGVHADGESFDPMTLAHQITERKPKYEDFFKSEQKNNQK